MTTKWIASCAFVLLAGSCWAGPLLCVYGTNYASDSAVNLFSGLTRLKGRGVEATRRPTGRCC